MTPPKSDWMTVPVPQGLEEYKQVRMSKLIPFSMFIEKYFHKQRLWKLPPLLDLLAPTLFREEYEAKEASKS